MPHSTYIEVGTGHSSARNDKRACLFVAIISSLCLGACEPPKSPEPVTTAPVRERVVVGELNAKGRLIFWSVDAFDHEEPFVLSNEDYGVTLINAGDEKAPKATYKFASQRGDSTHIVTTVSLDDFKSMIEQVPKGQSLAVFTTCSMPQYWGLNDKVIQEFDEVLQKSGLKIVERGVCYCPAAK